jgi:DUF2934 family protein
MAKPISAPSPKTKLGQSAGEIQEQIRHLAYELYEQRGREDGHDLDDWLQAESEVTGKAKAMTA